MESGSTSANTAQDDVLLSDERKKSINLKFRAVFRAFLANVFIALIKITAWYFTRSSAMFAEAVHSGVDAFNSICLMAGLKRGSRPADGIHPFGYGLETNIWTILACIIMFIGAAVSLLSSYNKIFFSTHSGSLLEP